jgi:hypothetical protein
MPRPNGYDAPMVDARMVLIEVHLAPGVRTFELSDEILSDTKAQMMTADQARAVGFGGLPAPTEGTDVRYVAVLQRDSRWILNALEADPNVSRFRVHEIA